MCYQITEYSYTFFDKFGYCSDCFSPDPNCSQCNTQEENLGDSLKCSDGYYIKNRICDYEDENCSNQDYFNSCSKCKEGCITCDTGEYCTGTACIEGYIFDSQTKNCNKCLVSGCKFCSQGINTCSECIDPLADLEQNCAKCKGGYRKSDNSNNCSTTQFQYDICISCDSKCKTCDDTGKCTSCINNERELDNNCLCTQGRYSISPSLECTVSCPENCQFCEDNTGTCTKCISELWDIISDCSCQKGYYYKDDYNQCIACKEGCITCTSGGTCSGQNCSEGYKFDIQSSTCHKCQVQNCKNCSNGISTCLECVDLFADFQENCQICKVGYEKQENSNTCTLITCGQNRVHPFCRCKDGFYPQNISDKSSQCLKCTYPCKTCTFSSSFCISCFDNINRKKSPDCTCLEGYYEDENQNCTACSPFCKTCNKSGICIECRSENLIPPLCEKGALRTFLEKKPYYLNDQGDHNDHECSIHCLSCSKTDPNTCLKCMSDKYRESLPSCKCIQGYHDNDGKTLICEKCSEYCQICTSNNKCSKCEENMVVDEYSGACGCKEGYHLSKTRHKCTQCSYYKGKCLEQCPIGTQFDPEDNSCEDKTFYVEDESVPLLIFGIVLLVFFNGATIYALKRNNF